MKKTIIIIIIPAILLMLFTFSGCTGGAARVAEKAVEEALAEEGKSIDISEGEVSVEKSEGEVVITDEEGNTQSLGGSEIDEDWPSVVPVSSDIEISNTANNETDGKKGWGIYGTYNGTGEEFVNYYKAELSDWNVKQDAIQDYGDDGMNYTYQVSNGTYLVTVFANETVNETNISLGVVEE